MRDDNDPFYTHDEFGRPLDAETVARRQVLKAWSRMSSDEFFAHMVELGVFRPDGTFAFGSPEPDPGGLADERPTDMRLISERMDWTDRLTSYRIG